MQIIVLNKQSFLDIAILTTGLAVNASLIARANNKAPSEVIETGDKIIIPENVIYNKDHLNYYQAKKILPATALTQTNIDVITGCEGIGCWAIGIDFKVS